MNKELEGKIADVKHEYAMHRITFEEMNNTIFELIDLLEQKECICRKKIGNHFECTVYIDELDLRGQRCTPITKKYCTIWHKQLLMEG